MNKAFTRKAIDDLEPRIRGILGTLLDDIGDPAGFDLMHAVGRPLPVIVIAEMLGVPPEDRERFRIWSARRARLVEPKQPRVGPPSPAVPQVPAMLADVPSNLPNVGDARPRATRLSVHLVRIEA